MEPEDADFQPDAYLMGMTPQEASLIVATLRWQAAGQPMAASGGHATTLPVKLAGREADIIEEQLPAGWDDPSAAPTVHYVVMDNRPETPMTPWLRFLLEEVFEEDED